MYHLDIKPHSLEKSGPNRLTIFNHDVGKYLERGRSILYLNMAECRMTYLPCKLVDIFDLRASARSQEMRLIGMCMFHVSFFFV